MKKEKKNKNNYFKRIPLLWFIATMFFLVIFIIVVITLLAYGAFTLYFLDLLTAFVVTTTLLIIWLYTYYTKQQKDIGLLSIIKGVSMYIVPSPKNPKKSPDSNDMMLFFDFVNNSSLQHKVNVKFEILPHGSAKYTYDEVEFVVQPSSTVKTHFDYLINDKIQAKKIILLARLTSYPRIPNEFKNALGLYNISETMQAETVECKWQLNIETNEWIPILDWKKKKQLNK